MNISAKICSISGWVLIFGMSGLAAVIVAARPPEPSLVLTAQENGVEPQKEFHCDGKIHGYLRLAGPATGAHTLEGIWVGPDGRERAHSHTDVNFPPPGRSTAYIWFAFPPRPGLLSGPDPDLDAQRRQSPGVWHVTARWDGQTLVQSTFTVICY